MEKTLLVFVPLVGSIALTGCENSQNVHANLEIDKATKNGVITNRWYDQAQVTRGNALFQANCATCHKPDASGTPNWKDLDANGNLPPPPLNGTAHAWHHSLPILRRTIRVGGIPLGGTMPGFEGKLGSQEIDDLIAFVQSHWSDEIYRVWRERNTANGTSLQPIGQN